MDGNKKAFLRPFLRQLFALLFTLSIVSGCDRKPSSAELNAQAQIEALRLEQDRIRSENEALKQEIANFQAANPASAVLPSPAGIRQSQQGLEKRALSYWITTSSHKRHNNRCRYFGTSRGRMCGPTEGIPCKLCGG